MNHARVVLNPLFLTRFYFQFLKSPSHYFLSGPKGIGKSFSFVSYSYLSGFVHHIPFQLQKKEQELSSELYQSTK